MLRMMMPTLVLAAIALALGCSERPAPGGAAGQSPGKPTEPDRQDLYAAVVRWRLDQPWGGVGQDCRLFVTLNEQDPDEAFLRCFAAAKVPVRAGSRSDGKGLLLHLQGAEVQRSGAVVVKGFVAGSGPNEHAEYFRWNLSRKAGAWVVVLAEPEPPAS
jgi:hypothetical protein